MGGTFGIAGTIRDDPTVAEAAATVAGMHDAVVDPELRRVARVLPRGAGPASLRAVATVGRAAAAAQPSIDRVRRRAGRSVPEVVRVGEISARVHRPPCSGLASRPGLLWIHGGGFVIGSAAQDDSLCARFARELDAVVVAPDYRLAPRHRYPTPVDDCHDALVWLAARPEVDPDRIAIGGASAGGGLAAALAFAARDRGEVDPVLQLLTYPMLDDRTVGRTDVDERRFRLWNNRANRYGWSSFLGVDAGGPEVERRAVPARRDDLAGLAPAWIGVGSLDLFHDEDVAYAQRLLAAGVPCDLLEVPGAFHGFDRLAPRAGVVRRFLAAQDAALRAAFEDRIDQDSRSDEPERRLPSTS